MREIKMSDLKPDIRIFVDNQTEYWHEDIVKQAGKILAIYVYDATVQTHLCSFTPSYWCTQVETIIENEVESDLHSVIDSEYITDYFSKPHNSIPINHIVDIEDFPGYDDREEYDEWFADIVDYLQGNSSYGDLMEQIEAIFRS
jgi:hypothetical protein